MSDHLFVNKIAAALLASALGFIGINKIAAAAMHSDAPEAPAYSIAAAEVVEHEEAPAPFPSAAFIAAMDVTKGAKVFKKCTSCHNATDGGKNGTGPALWNVVGRATANVDGFSYSSGMSTLGGTWGYEELDAFLTKPKAFVPKTKMAFNGLKKEGDRAALIAFLRAQSSTPFAMPVEAALPVVEGAGIEIAHDVVEGAQDMVEGTVDGAHESIETVVEGAHKAVEGAVKDTHDKVEDVVKDVHDKVEEHKPEGGH